MPRLRLQQVRLKRASRAHATSVNVPSRGPKGSQQRNIAKIACKMLARLIGPVLT